MVFSRQPGRGFNALSVTIGLMLLAFWVYFAAVFTMTNQVRPVHQMLMIGFGAVFTLFVVKLTCVHPSISIAGYVGLIGGMLLYTLVPTPQYPVAKVFVIAGLGAAVGAPLFLALRKVLPRRLGLRGEELAVIYAIVVIGAATAVISRSTFMAAEGWWREEYGVEKWLPPHFLPAADARDDGVLAGEGALAADPVAALGATGAVDLVEKGAKKGLLEGHAKPPWWSWFVSGGGRDPARWTFPAVFWIILILSVEFLFLFMALIFRKRWIEEERYPFPMAQLPLSIIGEADGDDAQSAFRKRIAWIAFAIGFVMCLSSVLSVSRTDTKPIMPLDYFLVDSIGTRFDLRGFKLIPLNASVIWVSPLVVLIMLFMPVDVLFTVVLTYVLVTVMLEVAFKQLTMLTGIAPQWNHVVRGIALGGGAGLAFWTLVFQWQELGRLFSAFARRTRSAAESGFFTVRNIVLALWAVSMVWSLWVYPTLYQAGLRPYARWLLLAGTGLAFLYVVMSSRREKADPSDDGPVGARSLLLLICAMGLTFIALTLPGRSAGLLVGGTLVVLVFAFASMRARGESPVNEFYEYDQGRLDATIQARYTPGPADGSLGLTAGANHWWGTAPGFLSHFFGWQLGAYYRRVGPQNAFLDTFKIGHETGTSAKDILKAVVLAMTVAAICTPALNLFFSYKYGIGGVNSPMYFYEDYVSGAGHAQIFGLSSMEPPKHFDVSHIYSWPVAGFIAMGFIMYMRREYVWFPLNPIGFLIGAWSYHAFGTTTDLWFSIVAAWLIKRTLFKWFGVRHFREKVQPVLVFAAMGMVLAMVLFILRYALELGFGVYRWS